MLRLALFDLDDTLYSPQTGLWDAIGQRISLYMIERLNLPPDQVPAMRDQYYRAFGTTLNGLRHDFHIEPQDYLDFVHDLPLDEYLQPDPALNGMLARLPLRKAIFTNADAPHVERVLDKLGIRRHFEACVDIHALNLINKPDPRSYARALELLSARAGECVFVEDSWRNLAPARELGMLTVLVSPQAGGPPGSYDEHITHLLHLERLLAGRIGQMY